MLYHLVICLKLILGGSGGAKMSALLAKSCIIYIISIIQRLFAEEKEARLRMESVVIRKMKSVILCHLPRSTLILHMKMHHY